MNYAPEFIGVGKYTAELAQFLAGRGHRVEVVTALPHYPAWSVQARNPWLYATSHERGVQVTRCPLLARPGRKIWRLLAPLSFAAAAAPVVLWRALRDRPDTLVCIEPTLLAAPAVLLAGRLTGARTVLHVQDLEFDAALATGYLGRVACLSAVARRVERALRRRFDTVLTISDAMASRLHDQVAPTPVGVLRNWVRPRALTPHEPAAALRRDLGVSPDARLVLYAGNLGAKQGLPVLIEAARHLRADPTIEFLIVGDGCMAGLPRAAAGGLPNLRCIGLLPAERMGSLLAAADLHVLPQDKAASDLVFPSKLGPLMMTGKPVVVTAEPGSELARWLGSAAIRCRPGDGRALAAAIRAGLRRGASSDSERARALASSLDAATILPAFEHHLLPPERERGSWSEPVHAPRPQLRPTALA